jgi:hypothetical protein
MSDSVLLKDDLIWILEQELKAKPLEGAKQPWFEGLFC